MSSPMAILGPGGVGGFLTGALEHAGTPVTVVARESTAAAIAADGLSVESRRLGSFHVRPRAVASLDGGGTTLIVATKATGLRAALDRVSGAPELVVPLLNGVDHLAVLRERFAAAAVPAAAIRIEAHRPATGRIVQSSPFLGIELAPPSPAVEDFARTLRASGVPVDVRDSQPQVMWDKLVRLSAMALTTSAYDLPIGPIRDDPERYAVLRAVVEEAAAVARAEGATVDPEATLATIDDTPPTLRTSMQRDIAAGREPELDAIAGAVLRAAARHGVACPAVERATALVAGRAGIMARR